MRTRQEIFDIVSAHLLTQNEKSVVVAHNGVSQCKYRGPRGLKCAIGVLIPDEKYDPSWEGRSMHAPDIVFSLTRACGIRPDDGSFASSLQQIHDSYDVCAWRDQLKLFSSSWNLAWPENQNHLDSQLQTRI